MIVLAMAFVQVGPCVLSKVCWEAAARRGWVLLMSAALHLCLGPRASMLAFWHCCVLGSVSGCRRWGVGGR